MSLPIHSPAFIFITLFSFPFFPCENTNRAKGKKCKKKEKEQGQFHDTKTKLFVVSDWGMSSMCRLVGQNEDWNYEESKALRSPLKSLAKLSQGWRKKKAVTALLSTHAIFFFNSQKIDRDWINIELNGYI